MLDSIDRYSWNPFVHVTPNLVVAAICLCAGLFMLAVLFVRGKRKGNMAAGSFLLFTLFAILSATILGRARSAAVRINLVPFWCIRYAVEHNSSSHWYYVVGNMILFLPLGLFLPATFPGLRKAYRVIFLGALCSVMIEWAQYYWHLGLCELDDVINNTWGAAAGYGLYNMYRIVCGKKGRRRAGEFFLSLIPVLVVFALFIPLILWP